jgi:hypothetical protein
MKSLKPEEVKYISHCNPSFFFLHGAAARHRSLAVAHSLTHSRARALVLIGIMWEGILPAREATDTTGPRAARLLSFADSPKVYQSGVIVNPDGSFNW